MNPESTPSPGKKWKRRTRNLSGRHSRSRWVLGGERANSRAGDSHDRHIKASYLSQTPGLNEIQETCTGVLKDRGTSNRHMYTDLRAALKFSGLRAALYLPFIFLSYGGNRHPSVGISVSAYASPNTHHL